MSGCVAALDCFFQRTRRPTVKEAPNVVAYYSGHYESDGLNCQACVSPDLQFMYFGVISPGSTNDNISYPLAKALKTAFDSLPLGRFGVADTAYTLCEGILIPFTGAERLDQAYDAFNYYLSQLRIRVEMAFVRLVNKFCILSGTISGPLDRASAILIACARLHNYIIREDKPFGDTSEMCPNDISKLDDIATHPNGPLGMTYLPVIPNEDFETFYGISQTREAIVEFIQEHDVRRPMQNLERKKREMAEHVVHSCDSDEWSREFISPL
jgi:hypothetical protein